VRVRLETCALAKDDGPEAGEPAAE